MCNYCYSDKNKSITGKPIRTYEWKNTSGYLQNIPTTTKLNDYLNVFILKGESDKKAGLMVDCGRGARYIDIDYCPFCGRKLN